MGFMPRSRKRKTSLLGLANGAADVKKKDADRHVGGGPQTRVCFYRF
jgi:hypothetical protein